MKTKNNSGNVLVTLADRNYVDQAKQLFSSAYWNGGWGGDYLLLAHNIPEKDLEWFRKKGILIYKCKSLWNKKKYGVLSSTTLIKIYLFKKYFKRWKKIIYLDGDIIVTNSLNYLLKTDELGAVRDALGTTLKGNFWEKVSRSNLGGIYDLRSKAFNSGMLAIDTRIIKKNTFNDLKRLIIKYQSQAFLGEQPLLNMYFYNRWRWFPKKFNLLINLSCERENVGIKFNGKPLKSSSFKVAVIHFAGNASNHKPWSKANIFYTTWMKNLELAEKMDMNKIPIIKFHNTTKINIWTKIEYYYLNGKISINKLYHFVRKILGKIIKGASSKLYYKLGGKY